MRKWLLAILSLSLMFFCVFNKNVVYAAEQDIALQIQNLRKEIKETEAYIKALKQRYAAVLIKKQQLQRFIAQEQKKCLSLKKKKQDRLSRVREQAVTQCLQNLTSPK
jgi:hypothetical protein